MHQEKTKVGQYCNILGGLILELIVIYCGLLLLVLSLLILEWNYMTCPLFRSIMCLIQSCAAHACAMGASAQ